MIQDERLAFHLHEIKKHKYCFVRVLRSCKDLEAILFIETHGLFKRIHRNKTATCNPIIQ